MIDLKKIADEISEKCGVKVSLSMHMIGWSDMDSPSAPSLHIRIGCKDSHIEKIDQSHMVVAMAAEHAATEWLATKDEREQAELEAARKLLLEHGEITI